jgi:gluconokinase
MSRLVVMGVSGCGKSTLAAAIARALGAELIEGDQHHLPASKEKMRRGIALEDSDREPWLDQLGALMARQEGPAVLTCSALKRAYRQRLRRAVPALRFVYVEIGEAAAMQRVRDRPGHFFPASLVADQVRALESPVGEAGVLAVDGERSTEAQLDAVRAWLGVAPSGEMR